MKSVFISSDLFNCCSQELTLFRMLFFNLSFSLAVFSSSQFCFSAAINFRPRLLSICERINFACCSSICLLSFLSIYICCCHLMSAVNARNFALTDFSHFTSYFSFFYFPSIMWALKETKQSLVNFNFLNLDASSDLKSSISSSSLFYLAIKLRIALKCAR